MAKPIAANPAKITSSNRGKGETGLLTGSKAFVTVVERSNPKAIELRITKLYSNSHFENKRR
jgi:hypothetical protein